MPKITETKAFGALGARNFRLYFFGQCCALTGSWMQRLAMVWLVMMLTGSGAKMGLIEFTNQCPVFVIGIFVGVFLDRYDLRRVLMATQIAMIIHSLILAFLIYTNTVTYASVLVLSVLLGIITSIDMPARQASISQMIEHPGQLQSALSLQSGSFNLARLIGPAIAGFVIKAGGEMACFLVNAVAHLAVLYAYWLMVLPSRKLASRSQPALDAIKEGMRYTWKVTPIRTITLFNYVFCFLSIPYIVLMPIFAKEVLDGDARHLGFLMGGIGLGALAGVYYLASSVPIKRLSHHIWRMQALFGISYLLFAITTDWRISLMLSPVMGFSMVSALVSNNSLIQALVDEDKRGRVLSIYTLGLLGFGPLGAYLVGKSADMLDVQTAALISAAACIVIALLHGAQQKMYNKFVPEILAEKGID